MKAELTTEEIYLLAKIKKVEVSKLLVLKSLLDPTRVRKMFILNEYRRMSYKKLLKTREIIELLMKRYDVSRSYVEGVIYEKPNLAREKRLCVRCSKEITLFRWHRNNGVCDNCFKDYADEQEGDIPNDEE